MNIFILDTNIQRCARYHCDRHVSKMILESVQIICTALNQRGFETPYRSTHATHPCVTWAGTSWENLVWLKHLTRALNREYRYRYRREKNHASFEVLEQVRGMRFENHGLTPFAQAMPETYRVPGDAVAAYRAFYQGEKASFARWTRRRPPLWWQPAKVDDAA